MQSACNQHQGFAMSNAQLGTELADDVLIALLLKRLSVLA